MMGAAKPESAVRLTNCFMILGITQTALRSPRPFGSITRVCRAKPRNRWFSWWNNGGTPLATRPKPPAPKLFGQFVPRRHTFTRRKVPMPLVLIEHLEKTYRQNFWSPQVTAVKGLSLSVSQGAIFGFLGPNGAGKTTTIKVLTGLIHPTKGRAELFGQDVKLPQARARLGYLPENPYIYPYLTAFEFVHLSAQLSGLRGKVARERATRMLEHVGIAYAADRPARKLSKGMLQRAGLAAALVSDPELLILDEPMSGLDPVGRKEVRDLIVHERQAGRTIFFSSHILNDVETLCDEVTILRKGEVVVSGRLDSLLRTDVKRWEVIVENKPQISAWLNAQTRPFVESGDRLRIDVEGLQSVQDLMRELLAQGAIVHELMPRHESLEDLFLRKALA